MIRKEGASGSIAGILLCCLVWIVTLCGGSLCLRFHRLGTGGEVEVLVALVLCSSWSLAGLPLPVPLLPGPANGMSGLDIAAMLCFVCLRRHTNALLREHDAD